MRKLFLVLAILLCSGCYSIMNPFSKSVLRDVLADPPPPGCRFSYTKYYADEPTGCYCQIRAMTADGEIAAVIIEVDEGHCLKESHETDQ